MNISDTVKPSPRSRFRGIVQEISTNGRWAVVLWNDGIIGDYPIDELVVA